MIRALVRRVLAARRERRFRYEAFGGIVQLAFPRALVFVDRDRARSLGYRDDERWRGPADGPFLSAPLEAHLQLTNRCASGCTGCYTGATPAGAAGELDLAGWCRVLDELARLGVFHVALGGGESAELPWLPDVARHARRLGLVPNLTTSGLLSSPALARLVEAAPLFGQINVSLDGVGEVYRRVRGCDGFAQADATLRALAGRTAVGINCVLTRPSWDGLPALFAHARRRGVRELELLRFKPSGRGAAAYRELRCTDAQHRALLPAVLDLARRYRRRVRLDCSLVPMVAHHAPAPELLARLAVYGCAGGDLLVAARASGTLSACSFAAPPADRPRAERLGDYWTRPDAFGAFRAWRDAPEPCRSCTYLALCRGGCRAVSAHLLGDPAAPDPECPRVIDARRHLPVL